MSEIAEADVIAGHEVAAFEAIVEQLLPPLWRQQQQRIVAQFVDELGVDQFVVEIGEALLVAALAGVAGRYDAAAEAEPALLDLLRGKDPVEAIERALVERRIIFER